MCTLTYILTIISIIVITSVICFFAYWMFAADDVVYRLFCLFGFVAAGICLTAYILLLVSIYILGGL